MSGKLKKEAASHMRCVAGTCRPKIGPPLTHATARKLISFSKTASGKRTARKTAGMIAGGMAKKSNASRNAKYTGVIGIKNAKMENHSEIEKVSWINRVEKSNS